MNTCGYYFWLIKSFNAAMDDEAKIILSGLIDVDFYIKRGELSADSVFSACDHARNFRLSLPGASSRSHALHSMILPSFPPENTNWEEIYDPSMLIGFIMQVCCLVMSTDNRRASPHDIYDVVISQKPKIIKTAKKVINGKMSKAFYFATKCAVENYISNSDNTDILLKLGAASPIP